MLVTTSHTWGFISASQHFSLSYFYAKLWVQRSHCTSRIAYWSDFRSIGIAEELCHVTLHDYLYIRRAMWTSLKQTYINLRHLCFQATLIQSTVFLSDFISWDSWAKTNMSLDKNSWTQLFLALKKATEPTKGQVLTYYLWNESLGLCSYLMGQVKVFITGFHTIFFTFPWLFKIAILKCLIVFTHLTFDTETPTKLKNDLSFCTFIQAKKEGPALTELPMSVLWFFSVKGSVQNLWEEVVEKMSRWKYKALFKPLFIWA